MKFLPSYEKMHVWECYSKELDVEYKQSLEEGKDIEKYKALFEEVAAMPDGALKEKLADGLFDLVCEAPQRADYPYVEPSDLEGIKKERKEEKTDLKMPEREELSDKMLGAWYGRICGCFLGKPVEGIMSGELRKILERTGNWPMTRYIDREEIDEKVKEGVDWDIAAWAYPRDFGRMPADDDTNYMLLGYRILSWYGRDFTPAQVAQAWLNTQVKNAYCTAERVAYRNFINGYFPPYSAQYKNPYREWIGAQIRGDFYGYINPCDPETAADMGFRDASISHIKNGIYGEMWICAVIAAAFGTNDVKTALRAGLAQVPAKSRLYEAVTATIDKYEKGVSEEECFADIHRRWDERNGHDWTHTVSNAEIVTAALLYGGKDYARSVGMAVETGLDTDCNGATVGSVLGAMLGFKALPASFTDRVCDTLESRIFGMDRVSIREMAEKTMRFIPEKEEAK